MPTIRVCVAQYHYVGAPPRNWHYAILLYLNGNTEYATLYQAVEGMVPLSWRLDGPRGVPVYDSNIFAGQMEVGFVRVEDEEMEQLDSIIRSVPIFSGSSSWNSGHFVAACLQALEREGYNVYPYHYQDLIDEMERHLLWPRSLARLG